MNETTTAMNFTASEIDDWRRYERVRKSGKHNMVFPEARRATKLDAERYAFVMQNYSDMKAQAELPDTMVTFLPEAPVPPYAPQTLCQDFDA